MDSTKKKCIGAPSFDRYIGIDYSGAKTPTDSLKGLRIYAATPDNDPEEIHPPPSRRRYWTRKGAAQWLLERLKEPTRTLVGIDHGFSFPLPYFHRHGLHSTGRRFSKTFTAIGRPTKITSRLMMYDTAELAWGRLVWAIPAG